MKDVSTYLYILGGRQLYEVLSANLGLPSPINILKYIQIHKDQTVEGEVQSENLKKFIAERNLPNRVFLSEDGTKIVPKIKYDPSTNQLIGITIYF